MIIPTESYEKIYQDYSAAIQWMSCLHIKLDAGRTSNYERNLRYWKDAYMDASVDESKKFFPDFVSTMFEIFDFVSIYKAFKTVPPEDLTLIVEKLRKAVKGPINVVDETSVSTVARNFLFEATVAAKVHQPRSGITAILDAKSDTGIKINKYNIWVECKRITAADNIEANVKKASKQLEDQLSKQVGSCHRGIVAIEISKILNRGDGIFVAKNDEDVLRLVPDLMDKFIAQYSREWQKVLDRRNKKIIGIIVRFAFMSTSEARNILVHTSEWAMNPRLGVAFADEEIQKQLVRAVKGAR